MQNFFGFRTAGICFGCREIQFILRGHNVIHRPFNSPSWREADTSFLRIWVKPGQSLLVEDLAAYGKVKAGQK
ncbi:MAG: hypothetical protein WBP58_17275 [Chitinophagaceae bacterium]